ncbi:MAG: substrate-binding domain-containing protein [Verrucomicrobia bacterium]|nr:substrate-binding domain-containing protein [Verrucomicrobiota bacterium]
MNPSTLPWRAPLVALAGLALVLPGFGRDLPTKPTHAQTELWKEQGRDLPTPELLQPEVDASLPAFQPAHDRQLAGHLRGAASDVLADLTKRWAAEFRKFYPNVIIDVPPPYAGSLGAIELIKGGIDFVAVSRELKPTDVSGFRQRFGYDPTSLPISGGTWRHFGFLDSVVFFVHPDNPLRQLSFTQLDALLSSTRLRGGPPITKWGQLGLTGEWADQPIHVWAVKPWNGFEEFVRQRVLSVGPRRGEWRPDLNFVETVFPVSPAVAADRYALGYAGLAYVGDGVKLLALSGEAGAPAVLPDYEEVARAAYPLSRLVYLNVNRAPGKRLNPALEEFARFILSREGQQVVRGQAIFLPLRSGQAAASRAQLAGP